MLIEVHKVLLITFVDERSESFHDTRKPSGRSDVENRLK